MHDHNLDDLIIDTVAPKNNKAKGFLTIVALFIVIIIVMIILNKTFINPDKSDALILEEGISTEIAPELKLQEQETVVVSKPIETAPVATEEVIEAVTEEPSLQTIIEEKVSTPTEPTQAPKVVETVEVDTSELAVKPVPVETKPEVVVPTPVAKPVTEVKTPTPTPVAVPKGTYFIQVGSYRQQPSSALVRSIKNNGFHYTLTKPNNNGIKKLLIGPYRTRAEVDKALKKVRDRIIKEAFVVKK